MRTGLIGLVAVGAVAASSTAAAQRKKAPPVVNAARLATIAPHSGFVDDPFLVEGASLTYVNADAASRAVIHVVDLKTSQAKEAERTVDISGFTTTPVSIETLDGDRFFVVSREPGKQATAAVVDASGKALRRFGPADEIHRAEVGGVPAAVEYSSVSRKRGNEETVEHRFVATPLAGRARPQRIRLVADASGRIASLDLRVAYRTAGNTRLVGLKGGTWNRKEDQRSPDVEGHYDVFARKFVATRPIADVVAQREKMARLSAHPNEASFLAESPDATRLERLTAEGVTPVELAQPFHHYERGSLAYHRQADGGFYLTMTIDPVNADAVARKKADPRYLDLYYLAPGASKAERRARVLLTSDRKISWRASKSHWAILEHHLGFDRGGPELRVYALK